MPREPWNLEKVRHNIKLVRIIQLNRREVHIFAICEESEQRRASATKEKVLPYRQTVACYYSLREQSWILYIYNNLLIQLNIQLADLNVSTGHQTMSGKNQVMSGDRCVTADTTVRREIEKNYKLPTT